MIEEAPSTRSKSFRDRWHDPMRRDYQTRGTFVETHVRVEHWYYDRGMHDFIYRLTFIGGVLANIRTMGYGGYTKEEESIAPSLPPTQKHSLEESPSADGRIDIVGGPPGAQVFLNGSYTCSIPCRIEEVEAGSYYLTVSYDDYNDWKERILVRRDTTLWLGVYLQQKEMPEVEWSLKEEDSQQPVRLYKWNDARGRVHITDDPPPAPEP